MSPARPALTYEQWRATCDTLHAHTQVLGKLAVKLAPPEPELQHAALRLTARGWETPPLPAPDGSGALVVALRPAGPRGGGGAQRRARRAHSAHPATGRSATSPGTCWPRCAPWPARWRSTRSRRKSPGRCRWTRTTSTPGTSPTRSPPTSPRRPRPRWSWRRSGPPTAAAPRRSTPGGGRSTSRSACSPGLPADPPSDDFIMRNAMDAQEVAVGWWPGDARYGEAAFYAYAHPAPPGFAQHDPVPAGRALGCRPGRVHPELGRRPHRATIRARPRWSSRARRSAMPASSAAGIPGSPPAPREPRRPWRNTRINNMT